MLHRITAGAVVLICIAALPVVTFGQAAEPAGTTAEIPEARLALITRYQETITANDLAAHLYLFSSDYFEGRETTTRGQKLAAAYLSSQYRRLGLEPRGTVVVQDPMAPEAYWQQFNVYGKRLANATLTIDNGAEAVAEITFPGAGADDAYLAYGAVPNVSGKVVFGGYGISDAELDYDDYDALRKAGLDQNIDWLMILRDEPLASADKSLLPTEDNEVSKWTRQPVAKYQLMFGMARPKGVLIVGDIGPIGDESMAQRSSAAASEQRGVGQLSLNESSASGPSRIPPFYVISTELANKIIGPSGRTVEEVKAQIDGSLEPVVFAVPDVEVTSELKFESYAATTENVAAFIEGSDPVLKDEIVVVSAHYDHIGMQPIQTGDYINNGADDDGSGTVAVLEMAEAFMAAKKDGHGPRRSVMFLNVAGEEKGLLGSAYYADIEPLAPIEKTVVNLNIDMIGRHDPTHPSDNQNYVYIIGSKLISQELHDVNNFANMQTGLNLELNERFNSKEDPNRFYARSDHWNFGKHGIPFIFYFTGTHEDYHQPGDEAHKIDYERMAKISRLIFATAWEVANRDDAPARSGEGFN